MEKVLDVRGLKCPMPIVKAKKKIATLTAGEVLRVVATDRGSVLDFQGWAKTNTQFALLSQQEAADETGREIFVHRLARKG